MKMIAEWPPGRILDFFRTGGTISASQYNAMDEDTRAAFKALFLEAENERVSVTMRSLTSHLQAASEKDPGDAVPPAIPEETKFPGLTTRDGD